MLNHCPLRLWRKKLLPRFLLTFLLTLSSLALLLSNGINLSPSTTYAAVLSTSGLVTVSDSVPVQVANAHLLGHHLPNVVNEKLTVGLVLQPEHQDELNRLLHSLYDVHSPLYHHWLPTGEFDARFGPRGLQLNALKQFLSSYGLQLIPENTGALLLHAIGTFDQVEAAFHTHINDYRAPDGTIFFANGTNIEIPSDLSGILTGVLGLSNVAEDHPVNQKLPGLDHPHYGGGPNGSGLIPSQIAGIYGAAPVYSKLKDKGQGMTLAVFEQSLYQSSDISVYEKHFGLPRVSVTAIPVDGGATDHQEAREVEADIELQIALAPKVNGVLDYNAPNSETGAADTYAQIASDNQADAISTSWGNCEPDEPSSVVQSENTSYMKMATQGQSIFAASGDNGAYDCLGSQKLQVDNPASQPYMTAAGGTSFYKTFDPGTNLHPSYPSGAEYAWNLGCTKQQCTGASGGGNSRLWASSQYQTGLVWTSLATVNLEPIASSRTTFHAVRCPM